MSANSRKVSPLAWVPTLYFAMGLPFIIVNMVATLMFRGLGIDDARITEEFPGIKNRGIKKCKAKDNQIIIHFSSVPLF